MKNFNITIDWESPTFGKYRRLVAFFTLFALFFTGDVSAQGGCTGISFSFEHYDPCKFRARYADTSDCFTEIWYVLETGSFSSWNVNSGAGFILDVLGPNALHITHLNGFLPPGNQVPLLFTLPPDLNTTMHVSYLDNCAMVGCEIIGGIPIESCPDPKDASIIGVKYRECGSLPYSNQTPIPGWPIQLLDADGNFIEEQVTGADGSYAFFDRPLGLYIVKEAQQPGWTSKVPASGQYTVDLAPSQQVVRNFGNCPSCSCDDIYMDVVQLPGSSDSCAYALNLTNTGVYCFSSINVSIASGSFASVTPAAGWGLVQQDSQHIQLDPPGDYLSSSFVNPCTWKITGSDNHQITVSTSWNTSGPPVTCSRTFSYQCPPPSSPAPCCPAGSSFGNELVLNSDFQSGNQNFTSDYTYFNPGGPTMVGKYSVLTQGQVFSASSQWACSDHTSLGGKMLIVDGYGGPIAWQQTVNVTVGTNYSYSAWVNNLVRPPKDYDNPQMALFVGNTQVAGPLNLPETPDQWVRLCGTWTAMASGPVVLSIRMLATTVVGNDVAIDDISFKACISSLPCSVSISTNPTPFCGTGTLTANPTGSGPFSYQWCQGQNTQSINVQNLPCGTVCSVSVTCADGSMSSASYTVTDIVPPVAVCNPGVGVDLGANCTYVVTPAFVDGGSTDNCQIQSMTVNPTILKACTNTIVKLTVTDWCGNTSTCTMGIQTAESVPPIMTCPVNTTIIGTVGPTGLCTATFNPVPPVAFDNCDPSVTITNNAPAVLQQGPNTITWTATDDCSNQTTCSQIVTVQCGCDCAGNLVTNGGFENGAAGFPNAINQINQCSGWYAATNNPASNNTGDWYSTSNPTFPGFYLNPNQTPLPAHCGEKYAGFFLNTCEGITTQLSQTITQGCSYEVGFWWTPAVTPTTSFSFYAVMSGGNCTMFHPTGSCSHQCNGDQHVIVNVTPNNVAGTWYYHSMTVTNAYPNVGYMTFTAAQGAPNVNNYIFVDDVCVKKVAEPCSVTASILCIPQNPTAYSSQATLGCGSVVTQVDWYFDGVGPNPSSCCLNSVLHPFTTFGLHTVCLVVTASNDGGHTICKDSVCKEVIIDHLPPTKCDSVSANWQKLHTVDDLCCYALQVDNLAPNCFSAIEMILSSGTFANSSVTTGWAPLGNLNSNQIFLVTNPTGFLPSGFFSPISLCDPGGTGPYTLTVNIYYGTLANPEKCTKTFTFDCPKTPIDSCCLDFDLFCQNVKNAVNVTVDNAKCKATLNIGALPGCDYIQKIIWGDGTQNTGNFGAGSMPMHTYGQSGTYAIQYLALEVNPHTGLICFEKTLTDTIVLACGDCCLDSMKFNNLIVQGFTVTQSGCSVTVTAPQFDGCYLFTTPPILDGENVQQIITPTTGSWTFNIPENGYHQICVTVFDQCNSEEMCTSVKIDCHPPVVDTSCCAYSMYFVNKYTDILHIKKVRVSGICGTEICCADPDEWQQVDGTPNYIEWFEDNVNGVPNGDAIDNDFIIYLKKSASSQNLEVEWFDAAGVVVCRHLLELDCDKPYNEDDDWALNTSTTALNDPNLFVFAARAPEEDNESDCEEAEEYKLDVGCDVNYTVTCSGGTDYVVNLSGPSGFDKYFWEVIYAPTGVTTYPTISSVQNPTFTATVGGSYTISLVAVTASLDTCTNEGDIDIPIIDPDFDALQLPCGYTVQFVAYGMYAASDVVSWSCPGYSSFPSSGNIVSFDFQSAASVSVTMTIKDQYDCTHDITKQVDIVDCEAGVEVDKYCPDPCSNGTTDVTVHFNNLSKGGKCPVSYTWDYGDGIVISYPPNVGNGETHTYQNLPCPLPVGGVNYTVTLTVQDAGTCSSTATTTLNISSCPANFTYKACPDGRVDFYGDEPGTWDFTGSIDIAKQPYSDKKDKEGRQKHVRVRYAPSTSPAIYFVKYTPHCPNGSECELGKEVVVYFDCCTKNHHTKDKALFSVSGKDYKLKGKFRSTQSVKRHKIVAKTRLRKSIFKIGGHKCWVPSSAFGITAEFDGNIYGREKPHGCNCAYVVDVNHPIVGPWFTPKVTAEDVWHHRKLHPRKDSITSTHTAEITNTQLIQFKLQLGKNCVPFHWWTDWY